MAKAHVRDASCEFSLLFRYVGLRVRAALAQLLQGSERPSALGAIGGGQVEPGDGSHELLSAAKKKSAGHRVWRVSRLFAVRAAKGVAKEEELGRERWILIEKLGFSGPCYDESCRTYAKFTSIAALISTLYLWLIGARRSRSYESVW
jgi:hypothetical protein